MALMVGVLLLVVTGGALLDSFGDAAMDRSRPSLTAEIGDSIFSQYIVPFEAVSVLLLAALIGAVVVARKE
jgi:NADH-quinone oxidoreductase subunit J